MRKQLRKRMIAGFMAFAISMPLILQHTYTQYYAADSCDQSHDWTGLKVYWTDIPTHTEHDGKVFGWPRKTYFKGGTGDWANMDGMYVYCVANHSEQPGQGSEAIIMQSLKVSDYNNFSGNKRMYYDPAIAENMRKFTLCLAAAATIQPGKQSDSDLASEISTTELDIMAQSVLLAIEGRLGPGTQILTMDKNAALTAYYNAMQKEYHLTAELEDDGSGRTTQLEPTIAAAVLAKREDFFNKAWDAATVMYNGIADGTSGAVANQMLVKQDPSNPSQYIAELPCDATTWENYYKTAYVASGPGFSIISNTHDGTKAKIVFEVPAGTDINNAGAQLKFTNNTLLTDLSQPVLYEFNFCAPNSQGILTHESFQTMFCAMKKEPVFEVHVDGASVNPDPGEGRITLEIHRYKHSESWQTNYNVDLIKLDSETGKPLQGSQWDILEYDTLGEWSSGGTQLGQTYLDHPVSEASSIGTNYNWANDNGTQFTRWEDEDACDRDKNVTGADGYLYESNTVGSQSGTKAHTDTYDYTYTKGYCTGHPKPEIEYYECDHDADDDCDCEELNAELDAIAEKAWQQQIEYCERLASEGGFFHTASESISTEAQEQLKADRDTFYKDFISLTYDYSAEEIAARQGYILHDTHTDDIPVERVVIHSSEYLNEISGGKSSAADNAHIFANDEEITGKEETEKVTSTEEQISSDNTFAGVSAAEIKEEQETSIPKNTESAATEEITDTPTHAPAQTTQAALPEKETLKDTKTESEDIHSEKESESEPETSESIAPEETLPVETTEEIAEKTEVTGTPGATEESETEADIISSNVSDESKAASGQTKPAADSADNEKSTAEYTITALENPSKESIIIESAEDTALKSLSAETTSADTEETSAADTQKDKEAQTLSVSQIEESETSAGTDKTETDAADKKKLEETTAQTITESEKEPETTHVEEESEHEEGDLPDIDLSVNGENGDDTEETVATASNAVRDEVERPKRSFLNLLNSAKKEFMNLFRRSNDSERSGGYARTDAAGPTTEGVTYIGNTNFEASTVPVHTQGARDIECWTFIVYDHRTEGEIHFNKRDLNLNKAKGDQYNSYADENGDGTLEGAVYGLFALSDIVHPDSIKTTEDEQDTGIVYRQGDLVAVTTTDRNGDGSFMTFTEAPGQTYDYKTGKIIKRTDIAWDGPSNLHTERNEADASVEDNEKFYGWNAEGSAEVTLTDSKEGGMDYYRKHSSNQGLNCGEGQDNGTTYPITDCDNSNGNEWIGRPLIVSGKYAANYYIKELSRSEGYELSIYGQDMPLTNREAYENGGDMTTSGSVSIGQIQLTQEVSNGDINSYNDIEISGTDTANGFDVTFKNLTDGIDIANFHSITKKLVEKEIEVKTEVVKTVPVTAPANQPVLINGSRVEAEIGDTITLPNGKTAQVNNTITDSGNRLYAAKSIIAYKLPFAADFENADGSTFIEKYNNALNAKAFREPDPNAPWLLVPVGADDQESFNNLTTALDDISVFHQIRIVDEIDGNFVVQYSSAGNPESIYDFREKAENGQRVWVRKNVTIDGADSFIYAPYDAETLSHNSSGFVINDQKPDRTSFTKYEDLSGITYTDSTGKSYWAYADGEQMLNDNGNPVTSEVSEWITEKKIVEVYEDIEESIPADRISYDAAANTYKIHFDTAGEYILRISYDTETTDGQVNAIYAKANAIVSYYIAPQTAGTYIKDTSLGYPGSGAVYSDSGTIEKPISIEERPIRQKVRVDKDIQKLATSKVVWYCLNCGYENADGAGSCEYCGRNRSTEETKTIDYEHDTYAAVHEDNISAKRDGGWYETAKDWLAKLLGKDMTTESSESIPNFRFKIYLKSNLERLYRDENGNIVWMDRNGNIMEPQYADTNNDGNYDTFTWKYTDAYGAKTVDFPEKVVTSKDQGTENVLESSNVQKIYTKVTHELSSLTTSARANNVWNMYLDPQTGNRENAGEIEGYVTSEREAAREGKAVKENAALYSYDGVLVDRDRTDYLQDEANHGFTRILETRRSVMENGADGTKNIEQYNYEKFFDGIAAANADIWDNDMHSSFTGNSMKNYPGQHWFETFYEKYQKDDADIDHTIENTDGADADATAGGDRDTSFKPFRWIRENVFGDRTGYEQYLAVNNGQNTENTINTSDFARANAEASDAVRQFAVKWYLEDEAAKLMKDNGLGENIAKETGTIGYDEAVYDEALFHAIAKAYNYLRPFYFYDLDTIYSVEWDSEAGGGEDSDYTTLSADILNENIYYNTSSYLPYGTYVIVEQQPQRLDKDVNDFENRNYTIEKPKELILPALYDATQSNDTTDNYDPHYIFDASMSLSEQAKESNYLIRFGEENSSNTEEQDDREFVIRAHGYYGDFEVYKYGLDIDKLTGTIQAPNGAYNYFGWKTIQEEFDPLKDYYQNDHRGEEGIAEIQKENGGNNDSIYSGYNGPNGNGAATANKGTYNGDALRKRFFYASITEDDGIADNILFKDGAMDDNNVSGMQWKDDILSTTGELTAYNGKYASMLVPWTVTAPADINAYDSAGFSGYADVNERNRFFTTTLRVNKVDSETGEYILHDDAIFGLYAASRYNTFAEIEADAKLIEDGDDRARFLMQFKPGDAKFYLQDTLITGSQEFLEAMGATELKPYSRRGSEPLVESMEGAGQLYTGVVPKGTPICLESERIDLTDDFGDKTGQMTVWSTKADIKMADPDTQTELEYGDQNVGYFKTSQPIGAGVYVIAELKAPDGYARSNPVAVEVYSDKTQYYVDGDMYSKVSAVRYLGNLLDEYLYE